MNETLSQLLNRRSVRSYENKKIKEEDLNYIKEAIVRAPTAGNMSLYSVIEVENQDIKEELAILCDDQPMIAKAPLVMIFLADNQKWIDFFELSGSEKKCNKENRQSGLGDFHLCFQDAIIAAQSGVVAADSLGIGSVYIGDIIENYEKIQTLLNLPKHAAPACMVIFGYSKNKNKVKLIDRCSTDSIFMKDHYQSKTLQELEKAYEKPLNHLKKVNSLPFENATYADFFYNKKYVSDFMKEMNRSTKAFLDRWISNKK